MTPLIRTGKRGENKWREASWEEALDLVAKRMKVISKQFSPHAMVFSAKTGEHHHHLKTFASAFGSINIFSHISSCPITYKVAFKQTMGKGLKRDFGKSRYILNFGHNLFEGIDISMTRPLAKRVQHHTCKFVVLDPRFSIIASKADEWFAIKPGTDLAFILALIHVWLRDKKYDKEFVNKYTIGIDELRTSVQDTTPSWQAALTGIKADDVERIAHEIYDASPHCIIDWGHKTTTSPAEFQRTRAIIIANLLMGNVEKEGGTYFAKKAGVINKLAGEQVAPTITNPDAHIKPEDMIRLDGAGEEGEGMFIPKYHGALNDIPKAILSKKPYPIKGWFMIRTNPLMTLPDPNTMRKAMQTLDLIVVSDIYLSETAQMADVVLPEATYLERDEGIMDRSSKSPAYMIRNRVVKPINQTKSSAQIFRALADKVGVGAVYKWKDIKQFRLAQAKGDINLLSQLMQKGYVDYDIPPLLAREKRYVSLFTSRFPKSKEKLDDDGLFGHLLENLKTPSGKFEIFSQKVESAFEGYGVPAVDKLDVFSKHEYVLTSGKVAIHTNGHTQNVPFLNMLMSNAPVWMHPKTAKRYNLKDGDTVFLENSVGKEKAIVMITQGIRPDTLFIYMGFGRDSQALKRTTGVGTNCSKLLSLTKAPVCGAMITNSGVNIIKA